MPSLGDCYAAAGRLMMERSFRDPDGLADWRLVHGVVHGQGPLAGTVYGHAWVEYCPHAAFESALEGLYRLHDTRPHEALESLARRMTAQVYDYSNGRQLELPAAFYYAVGGIELTYNYDWDTARSFIQSTGHWGHWELPETWEGNEVK